MQPDTFGAFPDFLQQPVEMVAEKLLGCILERTIDGVCICVRIVETEAYDQDDAASHTYHGQTTRNQVMFGLAGHLYVYFTYGMHYCANIVTGQAGYGSGVLIRAVEPIPGESSRDGMAILGKNRDGKTGTILTNGPGKLTQALGIDFALRGHDLHGYPLRLRTGSLRPGETVQTSPRIGISKAKDAHRRYYIAGNPYVSGNKTLCL